jgi:hypothetical protein
MTFTGACQMLKKPTKKSVRIICAEINTTTRVGPFASNASGLGTSAERIDRFGRLKRKMTARSALPLRFNT